MRKMKTSTPMYAFLQAGGYFEKGPEYVKLGKKLYRRQYLREHKKLYREKNAEHTIFCKPSDEHILSVAAKTHRMKTPEFIRLAALSYCQKKFLVPRLEAVYQLQQNIVYARTQIERIRSEKQGFFAKNKNERVEELLQSIEMNVRKLFSQPEDLEQEIRDVLKRQPEYLKVLQTILSEYDSEINGQQK